MKRVLSSSLGILLMASPAAFAQTATGNVLGRVTDSSGAVIPGVSVAISGEVGTRTTLSGADGGYRFLNMDYGEYEVTFSLQGFGTVTKAVTVVTGANATVDASLQVGGITESLDVAGETPLIDITRRGTSASISNEQLSAMPNARDPWGVMRNVAGALIDRVNIAGNENGQQAAVAGKGSTTEDKVWNLDGLVITDMSALGASPTYFDFGAFQEINVSTGGSDLTMQTGGFGIGLVTKRGTNTFHGGGRYITTDDRWSSSNISSGLLAEINKGGTTNRLAGGSSYCVPDASGVREKADHVYLIKDRGLDIGGPIIKDKLWFYATYGKQDIKLCRLNGTADATLLPSYNLKLNWQAGPNTMVSAFYFIGKKQKFGRAVGYFADESAEFLWDQDDAGTDGGLPHGLSKLEINHTFSPNLFASLKAAYYDNGFKLAAHGGDTQGFTLDFDNARATGSYLTYTGRRPQKTANVDASYFFEGLGGSNQLKFGFGYRVATTNDTTHYNGNQLAGIVSGGPYSAYVFRDGNPRNEGRYLSAYVGDVLTRDRLTVNVGVRFDAQSAKNLSTTNPANKSFPELAPQVDYQGSGKLVDWKDLSPRVGVSYSLSETRRTVVRGSYANYAGQLGYGVVGTAAVPAGFLAYGWNDFNGDRVVQPNEVNVAGGVLYTYNIDPANRTGTAPGRVDPGLKNKRDHEVVVGIDHELASNFVVGAAATYRTSKDLSYQPFLSAPCAVGAACSIIQPNQYVRASDVSAAGATVSRYIAPEALVAAGGGGRYTTNFDGYRRKYSGFEITGRKRLANKWAANIAFSYNNWTETYSDSNRVGIGDATGAGAGNPTKQEVSPLIDGGPVTILSGGSGKASFYSSFKWQVYADALVKLPRSFEVSAALFGRQGGVLPTNITTRLGDDGNIRVLSGSVDAARYDNLWNIDLRVARSAKLGPVTVSPSLELFNVLNNDLVLSRARNASSGTFGRVEEVISPRILRIGTRITF